MAQNSELEKLERRWMDNPLGVTFAPLAEAYRRAGEHGRALEVLEVGLAQHPAYVPALIVQARCHLDTGLQGAAEASFRSVLDSDPHNLIALKGLAEICEHGGRPAEAIRFAERLLEADPTHDEARSQLVRLTSLLARPAESAGESVSVVAAAGGHDAAEPVSEPAALLDASEPAEQTPVAEITIETAPEAPVEAGRAPEAVVHPVADLLGLDIERESNPFEELGEALLGAQPPLGAAPDQPFEEMALPDLRTGWGEELDRSAAAGDADPAGHEAVPLELASAVEWAGRETSVAEPDAVSASTDEAPSLLEERDAEPADPQGWAPWGAAPMAPESPAGEELPGSGGPDWSGWAAAEAPSAAEGDAEPHTSPTEEVIVSEGSVPEAPEVDSGHLDAAPGDERTGADADPVSPAWATSADVVPTPPAADRHEREWGVEPPTESADEVEGEAVTEPPGPSDPGAVWGGGGAASTPESPTAEAAAAADLPAPVPMETAQPEAEAVGSTEAAAEPVGTDRAAATDSALDEEPVVAVPEGVEEEAEAGEPTLEIEPELVITETMAEVFLRQGHRALALAVYAQLAERDPTNEGVQAAIAQLKADLEPPAGPTVSAPGASYAAEATGGESVGSFLARVLTAEPPRMAAPILPPAMEPASAGAPTRPAADSLSLSAIFGDDPVRAGAVTMPAGVEPGAEAEPTFDEFFSSGRSLLDPAPSQGLGGEEDLAQFNAWLRGLKR